MELMIITYISFHLILQHSKKKSIVYLPPIVPNIFNASLEKNKWKQYIKKVGVEKGYTDFKNVYRHSSPYMQHTSMHTIGALLYEAKGLNGITTCDSTFAYGCYHGFFGEAIQKIGISKIPILDKLCIERVGIYESNCQHGIGHGILANVGNENITKSLYICDTLTTKKSISDCRSGIFMEYNFNSMNHTSTTIRELDPSSPYTPCSIIPKTYQDACYFSQPEWWNRVYKKDYQKIGQLCENLPISQRKMCLRGMGRVAAFSSSFEIQETISKCNSISTKVGTTLCIIAARKTYMQNAKNLSMTKNEIDRLCNLLPQSTKSTCLEKD